MILKVLLQLDPRRFLQVLHLPIRGMRVITDPIVDSVVYLFVRLLFPRLANVVQGVFRLFILFVAKSARGLLGSSTTSGISDFSAKIVCEISHSTVNHGTYITLVQSLGRPNGYINGSFVCLEFGVKFNGSLGILKFNSGLHVFPSRVSGFY